MADDQPDFSGLTPVDQAGGPAPANAATAPEPSQNIVPQQEPGQITEEPNFGGLTILDKEAHDKSLLEEKYGTVPQQALTALEGAAQGVLGPLAPLAETATGLTTGKDILGRQTTNPFIHTGSEAVAFGAASLFGDELGGLSLAGAAEGIGKLAAKAIPVAGARGAAELATLAASHELARMVEGDPNQTLGSAAVSVGLSGVLGGLGGAVLEKYNPLKAYANNKLRQQASSTISKILGEGAGMGMGLVVGHKVGGIPGAVVGLATERVLAPIFTTLSKPFANKLASTAAAEAAYDYIYAASAGQKTIENAAKSLFSESFKDVQLKDVLPPSEKERDKLQAYLLQNETKDFNDKVNQGSSIAHYLPDHATESANLSEKATNYFKQLRPTNTPLAHLDYAGPIRKPDTYNYNRQLDIAQKPLMVIGHLQNGTLMPQDIQTMQTLYPGVHNAIVKNITAGLIENKDVAKNFSYAKKQAINAFMGGTPLDSTMTPFSAQQIMKSASPPQSESHSQPSQRKASGSELRQINKTNALYSTKSQSREINRRN